MSVVHLCRFVGWHKNNIFGETTAVVWTFLCGKDEETALGEDFTFPETRLRPQSFHYEIEIKGRIQGSDEAPTCETCILIHWADPHNTEYADD